jgi:hypothetical protein
MRWALRTAALLYTLAGPTPSSGQDPVGMSTVHAFLFGDLVYTVREDNPQDGFLIGQVVGHLNANLSEHTLFFTEVSATARTDSYAIEIERVILRHDFSDYIKLSAGRYHTPVSYWNTAFHHGNWLQTSVARPEMIKLGGRFIPVHFVGLLAEGTVTSSVAALSYEVGVGNGRGSVTTRGGDAGDANDRRAWVLGAKVRPAFAEGLQAGASLYLDHVSVPTSLVREQISTAHLVWDRGAPELALEYAWVRHEPSGTDLTATSAGWYAHGGVRLRGRLAALKPYVRLESVDVPAGDLVYTTTVTDYEAAIAGLRYDFTDLATAKAEFRRESTAGGPHLLSLFLQAAFAIPLTGGM